MLVMMYETLVNGGQTYQVEGMAFVIQVVDDDIHPPCRVSCGAGGKSRDGEILKGAWLVGELCPLLLICCKERQRKRVLDNPGRVVKQTSRSIAVCGTVLNGSVKDDGLGRPGSLGIIVGQSNAFDISKR